MAGKKFSPKNFWSGSQGFLGQTELQTSCSSHPHTALPNSQVLNPAQHHPSPPDNDKVPMGNWGHQALTAPLLQLEGES